MDELLRAYAKKRGEQSGPEAEMHPATRKLLQDEVKRTFAAASESAPSRQNWRAWRWPLVGLWSATAVLLVMFVMLNNQMRSLAPATARVEVRSKNDERMDALARRSLPAAKHIVVTQPPVVSAPAPMANAASLDQEKSMPSTTAVGTDRAFSPVPLTAAAPSGQAGELMAPLATRAFRPPPAAAGASESLTPGFSGAPAAAAVPLTANNGSDVAAGDFVQVHNRVKKGAAPLPPSNLLSNFRMLRSGQNVSVVDADGSVYNGQVLDPISAGRGIARGGGIGQQEQAKALALKDSIDGSNWTFNVAGMNHSLQQNIIFTGNVLDMPLANGLSNSALLQNASNAGQAPSTQNSRITGKVQVGGGKPFVIEAKPPGP